MHLIFSGSAILPITKKGYAVMNFRFLTGALPLVLALTVGSHAWASNVIGQVKTLTGEGSVIRAGNTIKANPGSPIYQNDTLTTADGSSMGVTFADNTTLSLGAASELTVDEFIYDAAAGNASFNASVLGGVVAIISGDIAKMKPENARINTPVATIGIRGTRFVVRVEKD
jgi:hypothetical protein